MHKQLQVTTDYHYYYYFLIIFELGQPTFMAFNPNSSQFQFVFEINTDIHQPTIIYINEDLNYPLGHNINVSPPNSLTWTSTSPNYYEFIPTTSTKNGTIISIEITAKTANWFSKFSHWLLTKIAFWKKQWNH